MTHAFRRDHYFRLHGRMEHVEVDARDEDLELLQRLTTILNRDDQVSEDLRDLLTSIMASNAAALTKDLPDLLSPSARRHH